MATAALTLLEEPGQRAVPGNAVLRRQRRVRAGVLLLLIAAVPLGMAVRAAALGDAPASVPERLPSPVVHVVQPGETLWSIARAEQPTGDVRPLVRALVRANGGAQLRPGDRLVLPADG